MSAEQYYVQPNVHVIDIDSQNLSAVSGEWNGTPGAETDPMPEEE